MLYYYFFKEFHVWIFAWIIQAVAYYFILGKMKLDRWSAVIPFLAERQFTKVLFNRMRVFYRPFVVTAILVIAAYYLDPSKGVGRIYMMIAFVIYGFFLVRLYWRLAKSFGKETPFALGLIFLTPIFLLILAFGKAEYVGIKLKPVRQHSKPVTWLLRAGTFVISAVELAVIVGVVGFITVREKMPVPMVYMLQNDITENFKGIKGDGQVVSAKELLEASGSLSEVPEPSREHFFPDHSGDENVVVMSYVIGSNLEDGMGLASLNISQMTEATKKGSGLTFVMEAGGSRRWFTRGIKNESYGRYEIRDGKLTEVQGLPDTTCLSNGEELKEFISWAAETYPADRYMLVLWDHGGGVPYGYGHDDLNKREDGQSASIMTSEVIDAIRDAGVKFDLIGFDACLMQDIEISSALEPYTDYYLASEEVEGGTGWYYTEGFGKLAEDPGISTEDFAVEMLSTFDQANTAVKGEDGEPDTTSTLSLVDTTLVKPAYEKLGEVLQSTEEAILADPAAFADMAAAASNAYTFTDNLQIDLIDYLTILSKADYEDRICSDEELSELITALQACVLYRNKNSAEGINGIAFAFPYKSIEHYGTTSSQLDKLACGTEKGTFDKIFSIIAVAKKEERDERLRATKEEGDLLGSLSAVLDYGDYTEEEWYVKGFEDYDMTPTLIDIPLTEVDDGYQVQLPEKAWAIIVDSRTVAYQKTEDGNWRYIGVDHVGGYDENDNPLVAFDGTWIRIDGELVCYEADPVRMTDSGTVFSGKVKAKLNDTEDIIVKIEWDAVPDDGEIPQTGRVAGYEKVGEEDYSILNISKGLLELQAGDQIQFIFDTYDENGELIMSQPEGKKILVSKQSRLTVEDQPIESGVYTFGGVLTDAYQRTLTTEKIEVNTAE